MSKLQLQVEEFHRAFGHDVAMYPCLPEDEVQKLRLSLIDEELDELRAAFQDGSLIHVADALADLLYVVYGTAVSCGLNMDPITDEVHRSNMSKKGGVKRADGKLLKPDTYSPANIAPLVEQQRDVAKKRLEYLNILREYGGEHD